MNATKQNSVRPAIVSLVLIISLMLGLCGHAEAGVLFESSWDAATGTSSNAVSDGGKWTYENSCAGDWQQDPVVYAGGPGGHNYLNMVTPGAVPGCSPGNDYCVGWHINPPSGNIFGDPSDFYLRFYFRIHADWTQGNNQRIHWFMTPEQSIFYLTMIDTTSSSMPALFGNLQSDFIIGIEKYDTNASFFLQKSLERERWYCYEIRIQQIGDNKERIYIKLDDVDVTSQYKGFEVNYNKTLTDVYAAGWAWNHTPREQFWLVSYDQCTLSKGWDVAAIVVRDDTWSGPVGGGVTDTNPPINTSIVMTGVEGLTDKTGSTAMTLTLSASDTGSGMSKMEFSRDGVAWLGEEDYATTRQWDLLPIADGTEQSQSVYVKFKDVAGNWSAPISASIILDKQPPSAPQW